MVAACAGARGPDPFNEPEVLEIQRGQSSESIAEVLAERGVIASKWGFLWHRFWNRDSTLLAGEYSFEHPMTAAEAMAMLEEGRVRLYPVTIPEGLTRFETADVVADSGLAKREEFLALTEDASRVRDILPDAENLEGCLFPETYSLAKTSTAEDLLEAMLAGLRAALAQARSEGSASMEDWDALVLASMIEEEAIGSTERGLVSSVFHNRIRRGMLMQCDPTVVYGLVLQDRYRGRLLLADLKDPHEYNTYVHPGLPPGPIASPGMESIRAAFGPSESDYLYFVASAGTERSHVFSESLREHNRAVRDYRRYQRSNR